MANKRVAVRYAQSVLQLALEQGTADAVNIDMTLFTNTLKQNRELEVLLKNPILAHLKKLAILRALFESKVNKLTFALFELASKKNRESYLKDTALEYLRLYREHKGIVEATVETAVALTPELRSDFVNLVKKQTAKTEVELEEVVNADVIGGYRLTIGDVQVDETVATRLKDLKLQLTDQSFTAKY